MPLTNKEIRIRDEAVYILEKKIQRFYIKHYVKSMNRLNISWFLVCLVSGLCWFLMGMLARGTF